MEMRKLSVDDLEQYDSLLRYAFQVTEKTLRDVGWDDEEIRKSKFPVLKKADVLGWFDGKNLASQFAVYPLCMNIYGTIYAIGFVTSVATYPEYTGQGLMSGLMKQSLVQMRERGQSLSLLYPYSIPLYRHKGWEIISDKMTYRIKDIQLPKHIDSTGYVRRVEADAPDLIKLHSIFAEQTHGCILRDELAWEEYWRWDVDNMSVAVYYSDEGQPLGYMVYLLKEDLMHIKEMIYLCNAAKQGLWKFISAHESMVDEVLGDNYFSEAIAFELEDSDIKETIRPYLMGRIVDIEQFLLQYRLPETSGEKRIQITFDISDDLLEWNNIELPFSFPASQCNDIAAATRPKKKAQIDIGALTALLIGYKSASYLHRLGRLDCDTDTLHILEQSIPNQKPYISDYI